MDGEFVETIVVVTIGIWVVDDAGFLPPLCCK